MTALHPHYPTADLCSCKGPWGIGLPFDHPIWQSIIDSCPVHGSGSWSGYTTWDGSDITFDWGGPIKRGRHERLEEEDI